MCIKGNKGINLKKPKYLINENELFINDKTKVSIDELRTSNTSWLNNYMSK